jgi:hypothetical protein
MSDVKDHPKWGDGGTHCALCTRPFATDDEAARHEGQECDRGYDGETPCWCESYCWVTWGGECIAELEFDPLSEIVAPLRVDAEEHRQRANENFDEALRWRGEAERLRADLRRIADLTVVYRKETSATVVPLDDAPEVLAACVSFARAALTT